MPLCRLCYTMLMMIIDAFKFGFVIETHIYLDLYLVVVDLTDGIHTSRAGGLAVDAEPEHGAPEAAGAPGSPRCESVRLPPLQWRQGGELTPRAGLETEGREAEPLFDLPNAVRRFWQEL